MKNYFQKLKCWFRKSAYLGFVMLFITLGLGCAATHKTTKTETEVTYKDQAVGNAGDQNNEVVEKKETTTTETDTKEHHPGILSSTFHAIGYVISIPFKIIGGAFRIIFGG